MGTRPVKGLGKALGVGFEDLQPDLDEASGGASASTVIDPAFEAGEIWVKRPRPKNLPDFHGKAFDIDPDRGNDDVSQWLRIVNRQLSLDIPSSCPPAQAEVTQEELVAQCQVSWYTLVETLEARFLPDNLEAKTSNFISSQWVHQRQVATEKVSSGGPRVELADGRVECCTEKLQQQLTLRDHYSDFTLPHADAEEVKYLCSLSWTGQERIGPSGHVVNEVSKKVLPEEVPQGRVDQIAYRMGLSSKAIVVQGQLCGHAVNILIDSGATSNFISQDWARKHQVVTQKVIKDGPRVELADGRVECCSEKMQGTLTLNDHCSTVTAYLFPSQVIRLGGRNALAPV
jgi:hypothetical protein